MSRACQGQANDDFKGYDQWNPIELTTACGAVFYANACFRYFKIYVWISLLGSPSEAKNYSCDYSIRNKHHETFHYIGPVHTLDEWYEDIHDSGSFLEIDMTAVNRSLNDKKELNVEITIKNLFEEAKDTNMESDVSDED